MATTSVPDVIECGGRVTIEQVLIFVDAPLVVLLVLAVVLTALTSKKTSSVPGVCTMFLKISTAAILRNRRRLRDHVISVRVTDTNDKSCNWVQFSPRSGTTYIDLPFPMRQSRLSLVEMRIMCPDTYHRRSPQYSEWCKSATSQLRRLMTLSIQSHQLDYHTDTMAGKIMTTPSEGVKVVYHLTPYSLKSSAQDILERGCLLWLSLCLAGLLSFGITQYIHLAYSEFATAVLMNALNILITTANVIVAAISGVLAFLFVKILATPFRRYSRHRRRGKYRRLGHHLGDKQTSVMSSPSIHSFVPDGPIGLQEAEPFEALKVGECDATEKIFVDPGSILLSLDVPAEQTGKTPQDDELFDNKVNLVPPFKSKSLPCLDCLTLKSANPNPSRHSLLTSASSRSMQCLPCSFSISCETSQPTNEDAGVTEEIFPRAKTLEKVAEENSSLTDKPEKIREHGEENWSLTNRPTEISEESSKLINRPVNIPEENTEETSGFSLPRSSESDTSVSSTFTIESLPEELPGGVYRTKKYIYRECSTPWYYNSWLDDSPFMSSAYVDFLSDKINNARNKNSNNNNSNSNESTVYRDIEENIEMAELSQPRIKITRSHAPVLLVIVALLGAVIVFHFFIMKASLCQQILQASIISWVIASFVLMLIHLLKLMYAFCQRYLNN